MKLPIGMSFKSAAATSSQPLEAWIRLDLEGRSFNCSDVGQFAINPWPATGTIKTLTAAPKKKSTGAGACLGS
jgi:hypothetical protein